MSYTNWKNKQAFASAQQQWDDMLPEDEEGYYDDEDSTPSSSRVDEEYCLRYLEEREYNTHTYFDIDEE